MMVLLLQLISVLAQHQPQCLADLRLVIRDQKSSGGPECAAYPPHLTHR